MSKKKKAKKVTVVQRMKTPSEMLLEKDIKDLYYLDELIKDMHVQGVIRWGEKYMVFLQDWYDELYKRVQHDDKERAAYLKKQWGGMDRGWIKNNFLSVEERDLFLESEL